MVSVKEVYHEISDRLVIGARSGAWSYFRPGCIFPFWRQVWGNDERIWNDGTWVWTHVPIWMDWYAAGVGYPGRIACPAGSWRHLVGYQAGKTGQPSKFTNTTLTKCTLPQLPELRKTCPGGLESLPLLRQLIGVGEAPYVRRK